MSERAAGEDTGTDIVPADYLWRLGQSGEGPHDIAFAALMLAALDHPETKLAFYRAHLSELADAARKEAGEAIRLEPLLEEPYLLLARIEPQRAAYWRDRYARLVPMRIRP